MDRGAYSIWGHKRVGHDSATKQWHYLHLTGGETEAQRDDFFRCTQAGSGGAGILNAG